MAEMMKETSELGERMDPLPEKMIVDENTKADQSKESLAETKGTQQESNVIRIVNLSDRFIEATLRDFIQERVQPTGKVQELYIRKNNRFQIFYAYVIFELSCDAVKATQILNGYTFNTCQFDVALVGPHLPFKKYKEEDYFSRLIGLQEARKRAEPSVLGTRNRTYNLALPYNYQHYRPWTAPYNQKATTVRYVGQNMALHSNRFYRPLTLPIRPIGRQPSTVTTKAIGRTLNTTYNYQHYRPWTAPYNQKATTVRYFGQNMALHSNPFYRPLTLPIRPIGRQPSTVTTKAIGRTLNTKK